MTLHLFFETYRRLASRLHPDTGGAPGEFEKLQRARDVLLGEEK